MTCSGEPLTPEELVKREQQRRERKILRQLEKQQRKLAAKGVDVDLKTLRKEWDQKRADGIEEPDLEDDEIDVVGDEGLEEVEAKSTAKKPSFSIDSLLSKISSASGAANSTNNQLNPPKRP